MHHISAEVISNCRVGPAHFKMALHAPQIARAAKAGQFIHVRCSEGIEPLLRRPFSIHRITDHRPTASAQIRFHNLTPSVVEILYKVVGRGTRILSNKKSDERLDIIGPLGNGFDLRETSNERRETRNERRETILVAGGMGIAPLLRLAEEIVHSPQCPAVHSKNLYVIIGAKTKREVFCVKDFKKLGCDVYIATDDGSSGKKGLATEVLGDLLSTIDCGLSTIYACGPKAMLKEIAVLSRKGRIPCQVSLEENMGCGVGACLGCVAKAKWKDPQGKWHVGYRRVCKDGPVFDIQQIIWS